MQYELSASAFFTGLLILIASAVFLRFHQWAADNFGSGVGDYDKYKLAGFIGCGLGLLVMTNLHAMLLMWFFGLFFGR